LAKASDFVFEPLDKKKHDRAAFSFGVEALDNYLKNQAGQDSDKRVAVVIVATANDGRTIAGYYTLSQHAVDAGDIPVEVHKQLKLPKYPVLPATLIGRLARATAFKGHRIGELLLMSALEQALKTSRQVASLAVVVDAKDESAVRFYSKYGFIPLPEHPNRLFLPMKTIQGMFS
jgi:predicted GNAT family N-acyltransferase